MLLTAIEARGTGHNSITKGSDCNDAIFSEENKCDDNKCKKRTGYLHQGAFKNKTATVGDNIISKSDNFRDADGAIVSETNCNTGKVPSGSKVKVTGALEERDFIKSDGSKGKSKYYPVEYDECLDENDEKRECSDKDCDTTKEALKKVFANTSDATLKKVADALNKRAKDFGINTKDELRHFIAQAGHESNNFTDFEENLNYRWKDLGTKNWKRYFNPLATPKKDTNKENPNDYKKSPTSTSPFVDNEKFANHVYADANRSKKGALGNTETGDGYKFRGRGIFQLTGRSNYQSFTTFYKGKFDKTKDFITSPDLLASDIEIGIISALWFYKNRVMNKLSIDSNTTVAKVTQKVNGGSTGLTDRKAIHTKAKKDIDCK